MTKDAFAKIAEEQKIDRAFGLELLREFYGGSSLTISFNQLVSTLEARRNQRNFVTILGGTVLNSPNASKSDAISAMKKLGKMSKRQIPSRNQDFISAIIDKATEFSYVDAAVYTAKETAKTVIHGVESVGNTLINTGKILNYIFPAVVLLALYFVFRKKFVD